MWQLLGDKRFYCRRCRDDGDLFTHLEGTFAPLKGGASVRLESSSRFSFRFVLESSSRLVLVLSSSVLASRSFLPSFLSSAVVLESSSRLVPRCFPLLVR